MSGLVSVCKKTTQTTVSMILPLLSRSLWCDGVVKVSIAPQERRHNHVGHKALVPKQTSAPSHPNNLIQSFSDQTTPYPNPDNGIKSSSNSAG